MKYIDGESNTSQGGEADELATTGASVNIGSSPPPSVNQVLVATSSTSATWQTSPAVSGVDLQGAYDNGLPSITGNLNHVGNLTTTKIITNSLQAQGSTYSIPADGTNTQILSTNGAGSLSWRDEDDPTLQEVYNNSVAKQITGNLKIIGNLELTGDLTLDDVTTSDVITTNLLNVGTITTSKEIFKHTFESTNNTQSRPVGTLAIKTYPNRACGLLIENLDDTSGWLFGRTYQAGVFEACISYATTETTSPRTEIMRFHTTYADCIDLFPISTNTYDLGSSSKRWDNIYGGNLNTDNITGKTSNTIKSFSNLAPVNNNERNLGGSGKAWANAYVNAIRSDDGTTAINVDSPLSSSDDIACLKITSSKFINSAGTEEINLSSGNISITATNKAIIYAKTSTSSNYIIEGRSNVTSTNKLHFVVAGNGNCGNTNNVYAALSDERFKFDIQDTRDGYLHDLLNVRIRKYKFIDNPEEQHLGVVAQEIEQIFPRLIQEDSDGVKSVKMSILTPMILKAVQEQQVIINQQQEQITQQQEQINIILDRLAILEG